jgi:hypothetical protein
MRRIGLAGVWMVAVFAGCNGFPDTVPITEAERKPENYPTYTLLAATPLVQSGNQRYMVLPGAVVDVPASALRPVAGGLSASVWDSEPYGWLFQRSMDGKVRAAGEIR